jgi:hypothetical protein
MAKAKRNEEHGFVYQLGECWIGPQLWYIEFCDSIAEPSFRVQRHLGIPKELGKTIWVGHENVIRLNANMLKTRQNDEIVATLVHELGHVALEGRWSKGKWEENEVEDILCAIDAPLAQALLTLNILKLEKIEEARKAYETHENGTNVRKKNDTSP